jgi:hypothetical protein
LREEGEVVEREAIDAALREGKGAAQQLLKETPARLALRDAVGEAQRGRRVVFVVDRVSDTLSNDLAAHSNLEVVHRNEAVSIVAESKPDLLMLACRGSDALRILMEVPAPPAEVRMRLTPHDALVASRGAQAVLGWPELEPVHRRCRDLLSQMPPRLDKVLGLGGRLPAGPSRGARSARDRMGGYGSGGDSERARVELVATLDDGETVPFVLGASVIVLRDNVPVEKRARELKEGDRVVLPPADVVDDIARNLGWAGEQALIDDIVNRYKRAVGAWNSGAGAGLSAAAIARRMRSSNPNIPIPSEAAIRYWLSASDHEEKPTPYAPGRSDWFAAFCAVIGFEEGASAEMARHFEIFRARLRHDGHVRTGLVERMLFYRYDATVHRGVSQERINQLRQKALRFVREIVALEKGGQWQEGQ